MRTPLKRGTLAAAALALATGGLFTASTLNAGAAPQAEPVAAYEADSGAQAAAEGQWLTGYWQNFDNGAPVMPISEVPAEYNMIAVAFAGNLAGTPGGITFDLASGELGGYTEEQFKADIAAVQAEGRKVVISVGGQNGHVDVTNPAEAAGFAESTHVLMEEYGFDGVDIDLEHGVDAQHMEMALRDLHGRTGDDLIVTMAPQTIDFQTPDAPYHQLAESIPDILTIINMQYYNSGTMLGCDGAVYEQGTVDFLTALACIQLELDLEPSQVGLGLPATPEAAGGGYQDPSGVVSALNCLEEGTDCQSFSPAAPYGPIGGAMTWSINWDAGNGYNFATTVGGRLGTG